MRIGVLCSGGDSPGMNACLRAVVRSAVSKGHDVFGINRGYQGLLVEDFFSNNEGHRRLGLRSVSNIIGRGGTILRAGRCQEFYSEPGIKKAVGALAKHHIDALVPIGGDGTFRGCLDLAKYWPGQIVGCPGTIDNDLFGTDFSIGFQTAVATAVDAIDKLRDTAESHRRMFVVEVMGRHCGLIALHAALGGGAELVCLPEAPVDLPSMIVQIAELKRRGKTSLIIVVAEGRETGGAENTQRALEAAGCSFEGRAICLGHIQRGGSPTVPDRILATRLGDFAVRAILDGATGAMAGEKGGRLTLTPFAETVTRSSRIPADLLTLLGIMSH